MKIVDTLNATDKTLFSFELLPPLKGKNIEEIYKAIEPLLEFKPININITFHQQESVYQKRADGLLERKIVRKRPGTVAIAAAVHYKYKITVVPHIICGGFNKEETEDVLIDFNFLDMHNLLVLRGDPPKGEKRFTPMPGGHVHAIDLIHQIMDMNNGIYLDKDLKNPTHTDFSVGIAGYPEKHYEAPNLETDLKHLKEKIDAGGEYIVTQMFFNNQKFFDFEKRCRDIGIHVPIIPGIKPITFLNDISLLPQVFHIDIPEELVSEIAKCKTNKEAKKAGIEWTIQQSKELIKHGVPALHYYTIGISDNIKEIAKAVF